MGRTIRDGLEELRRRLERLERYARDAGLLPDDDFRAEVWGLDDRGTLGPASPDATPDEARAASRGRATGRRAGRGGSAS